METLRGVSFFQGIRVSSTTRKKKKRKKKSDDFEIQTVTIIYTTFEYRTEFDQTAS